MQFRRELGFDSAPFDPDDRAFEATLIVSKKFLATFPIAAGAVGLEYEDGLWVLKWVWLHPYERSTALFDEAWGELERLYGLFFVEGPYTPAMGAFLRRRGIPESRFDPKLLE